MRAPLATICLLFLASSVFAVDYVEQRPMDQVVKVSVQEVHGNTLHVITWAGDIQAILANGNNESTQPGSIFAEQGLNFKIKREDYFPNQVEAYMRGDTPYLRGTVDQIITASAIINKDPRTKPHFIYQETWSAGGDALVVRGDIKTAADFKGKTIAMQANAPQFGYILTVLSNASVSVSDVKFKFTKDLTGTDQTPAEAMRTDPSIDIAVVITPDALALTSNGSVGTGAEESAQGARIFMTTKSANRIISDVYVVRADYLKTNGSEVKKFVHGLLKASEAVQNLMKNPSNDQDLYDKTVAASANILLDDANAKEDLLGLYGDCEYVGFQGNVLFFSNPTYPRRMEALLEEMQGPFARLGLIKDPVEALTGDFNYEDLREGLINPESEQGPKFNQAEIAKVIGRRAEQGTLSEGELMPAFEINFGPNQSSFNSEVYKEQFDRVVKLASTYGGAVITVEGHSDPLAYVDKKKAGESEMVLNRMRQAGKNLSLNRAISVQDSIVAYAKGQGVTLSPEQFTTIGHGYSQPKTGLIGNTPIRPANKQEWLSNMRVVFRIVNVEAEASVFNPL